MKSVPTPVSRPRWKRLVVGLIALVAVCASPVQPASAQGYSEGPDYNFIRVNVGPPTGVIALNWNLFGGATRIPYYIHSDLVARGFRQPIRNAFETFEDDPNSNISFIYMGSTSVLSEFGNACCVQPSDGVNVVSLRSLNAGTGIGLGGLGGSFGINGNGQPTGMGNGQFDISLSSNTTLAIGPTFGAIDVESLVLHELGHALGLDHPTTNTATAMWGILQEGSTKRQLHPADLLAIRLLYPCGPDDFADAPAGLYFSEAVQWAGCTGITTGTSATLFSPHSPVSRGQMATFLWRYAGEPAAGPHGFSDVSSGAFYNEPVEWLAASGITTGTSPTTFSPNNTVTRGQMAAFLWRYAGEPAWSGGSGFSDVSPGAYYATAVAWMAGNGITTGTTATTFSPDQPLTRAQAVTFLSRYNDNK